MFFFVWKMFFWKISDFFFGGKDKEGKGICFVSIIGEVGLGWQMLFGVAKLSSSLIAFLGSSEKLS